MTRGGIAAVYVARVVTGEIEEVYPPERDLLIQKTKNEGLRRERYSVWLLLRYALSDALSINIRDLDIGRTDSGKWIAEGVYFSLSHTSELVAVAVSDSPVGVDIEAVRATLSGRCAERILTEHEISEYNLLPEDKREEYIISKWSGKEALFKKEELSAFIPHDYRPTEENTHSYRIEENGKAYILTVATDGEARLVDLR